MSNGLSGLCNLGNTCYLNSCLQVLFHTEPLLEYLRNPSLKNHMSECASTQLFREFCVLTNMIWKQNCIIKPHAFLKEFQRYSKEVNHETFTSFDQNDASECLVYLLDSFHKTIKRNVRIKISGNTKSEVDKLAVICYKRYKDLLENDYSSIVDLFYGIQVTQIRDYNNNKVYSSTADPFMTLELPLPDEKNLTLEDCLNSYIDNEPLIDDNAWYNDKKKKKFNVNKQMIFWSLPKIMTITLKRFRYDGRKNRALVSFPLESLDMTQYAIGYGSKKYIYDCYAVCNHSGVAEGGHYTAYIKTNDKWYHFNDTSVTPMSPRNVVTAKAYTLFYKLSNN